MTRLRLRWMPVASSIALWVWLLGCWAAPLLAADARLLSYEALPAVQSQLPRLKPNADYRGRALLARGFARTQLPQLLRALLIDRRSVQTRIEPGGFEGRTNASLQSRVQLDAAVAERLAAALGYVLQQRSVLLWDLQPDRGATQVLVLHSAQRRLNAELAHAFFVHAAAIEPALAAGYRADGQDLVFVNLRDGSGSPLSGLSDGQFETSLSRAAASFRAAPLHLRSGARISARLIANDWHKSTGGAEYLRLLPTDPALIQALERLRRDHQRSLRRIARQRHWD